MANEPFGSPFPTHFPNRAYVPEEPLPPLPVEEVWQWRWSFWTGIMYGPIPVGVIVAAIVGVLAAMSR